MTNIHADKLLILDFGSQYTQLIARRIREIGIYCELWACDVSVTKIAEFKPKGIILSGGPDSVSGENAPQLSAELFSLNIPILGICYGMQAMAQHFGGKIVQQDHHREFGYAEVNVLDKQGLLGQALDQDHTQVWMSHGDQVGVLPEDFIHEARSNNCPIVAMHHKSQPWYGVQFHPEVTHTEQGLTILREFATTICGCDTLWNSASIVDDAIKKIREQVGNEQVILGLSGGVDSSVTALLLQRAIGDQLTCIFVDNGLLRLNEAEQVMAMFHDGFGLNIRAIAAEETFLSALVGVTDPEQKRKVIGNIFIHVFEEAAQQQQGVKWLAQGTIYPDVIESAASATGKAHVIKSHHNVGGLPENMSFQLVEPLRELFKDEVRKLGQFLGLPHDMLQRHPFPGPGLGVRVLAEVKKEHCDLLRQADAIFIKELYAWDYYHKVSQAFAVFLPIKSVGVIGDTRQYDYVIALRAVETIDFMTARWAYLPYELLDKVSSRIINEVRGISRVVYDISGKPPATIEWE